MKIVMSGFTFATASARYVPGEFTRLVANPAPAPATDSSDFLQSQVSYMSVATSRSAMLSSARHAGENSLPLTSKESPKAQPPGTAQAEGPRVQDKSGE